MIKKPDAVCGCHLTTSVLVVACSMLVSLKMLDRWEVTCFGSFNNVPDMSPGDGVHAGGGLIQEHNVGIPQQRTRHTEAALHASAVAATAQPPGTRQPHLLQQLLGLLSHQLTWQTLQPLHSHLTALPLLCGHAVSHLSVQVL